MDCLTFISILVSSLAWPVTVILGLYMLRGPISGIIPLIRKLKYKDLDIEFNKIDQPAQISTDATGISADLESYMLVPINSLLEIAKVSPKVAVIEAGRSLKYELNGSIDRFIGSTKMTASPSKVEYKEDANTFQLNHALIELGKLLKIRDDLMENPEYEVTEANAKKYILAANKYCSLIKSLYPI